MLIYEELVGFLSAERLARYRAMAQGNPQKAAVLYVENLSASASFYVMLHWLEVGLRNAVNRTLIRHYGEEWFDTPRVRLSEKDQSQIQKARAQLRHEGKSFTNGQLIAQLNFGFWVHLFDAPYDTLWRHCLRQSFAAHPGPLERKQISKMLHPILKLRNRIAHYEPILEYDLVTLRHDIQRIVSWIDPNIGNVLK